MTLSRVQFEVELVLEPGQKNEPGEVVDSLESLGGSPVAPVIRLQPRLLLQSAEVRIRVGLAGEIHPQSIPGRDGRILGLKCAESGVEVEIEELVLDEGLRHLFKKLSDFGLRSPLEDVLNEEREVRRGQLLRLQPHASVDPQET